MKTATKTSEPATGWTTSVTEAGRRDPPLDTRQRNSVRDSVTVPALRVRVMASQEACMRASERGQRRPAGGKRFNFMGSPALHSPQLICSGMYVFSFCCLKIEFHFPRCREEKKGAREHARLVSGHDLGANRSIFPPEMFLVVSVMRCSQLGAVIHVPFS